jgi:hypothetical protein
MSLTDSQIIHGMGTDVLLRIMAGMFTGGVASGGVISPIVDTATSTAYTFTTLSSSADLQVLASLELASRI